MKEKLSTHMKYDENRDTPKPNSYFLFLKSEIAGKQANTYAIWKLHPPTRRNKAHTQSSTNIKNKQYSAWDSTKNGTTRDNKKSVESSKRKHPQTHTRILLHAHANIKKRRWCKQKIYYGKRMTRHLKLGRGQQHKAEIHTHRRTLTHPPTQALKSKVHYKTNNQEPENEH